MTTHEAPGASQAVSVLIAVKAVPGASRDVIVGVLGDRLKVRVAAPPEGGKANAAIMRAVACSLGIKASAVTLVSGQRSAEKTIRILGVTAQHVSKLWSDAVLR